MNIMLIIWKNRGNMNNFGEIIKDIRKKNNLTQKELADKLYVTYQAVSKWENNKSIPDISILQNISKMFNIDLNYLTNTKKRNNTIYFILIIIFLILSLTITILITKNHTHDFEMRTIETTCNDFNLSGTIAYNKDKTAIFISEIDYCGLNKDQIYDTITSTLYQNENNKEKIIITNKEKNNLSLNDYLKDLTYHIDNYKSTCLDYNKNELYIKIELQKKNESTITYTIPLKINDTCN